MIQTKHILNGTTKISYIASGEGKPLVLLHGNSQSSKLFKGVIPQLVNDGYAVYAIDSRGHGKSDKPKVLTFSDMANDVLAVIKHENLISPILFGFSDGGVTGLVLAMKHADALEKLIACGIRLSPKGIKPLIKIFWRIAYFFTRLPRLKLLLTQPDIKHESLRKIKTKTILVHAKHDLARLSHSLTAVNIIPNCELMQLPKETHSSYVRNSKKLLRLLTKVLS